MSELSHETGRQIGVLLNRKGQVEYVMVGDANASGCPILNAFASAPTVFAVCGVFTLSFVGEKLTQDDLTDLALLRLDLMATIDVDQNTGLPNQVHAAHLLPTTADEIEGDTETCLTNFWNRKSRASHTDFVRLINSLEEEMARNRHTRAIDRPTRDRVILVGVTTGGSTEAEESMAELEELALSADVIVLDKIIQRRQQSIIERFSAKESSRNSDSCNASRR
jgi:GTP-binding protein HflX